MNETCALQGSAEAGTGSARTGDGPVGTDPGAVAAAGEWCWADARRGADGYLRRVMPGTLGPQAAFAARDVIALTMVLTLAEGYDPGTRHGRPGRLRHRMSVDALWHGWCTAHLADRRPADPAEGGPQDVMTDALRGWWTLTSTWLPTSCAGGGPSWTVGLRLARRALDAVLLDVARLPGPAQGRAALTEVLWHPELLVGAGPADPAVPVAPLACRVVAADGTSRLVPNRAAFPAERVNAPVPAAPGDPDAAFPAERVNPPVPAAPGDPGTALPAGAGEPPVSARPSTPAAAPSGPSPLHPTGSQS
ncbi:hypothetical protein AB0D49_40685 [Streptomyces sp. NPDC048290]|uniref:hypothetical protein n=1 Tax=Streptomyces sp. NPDC048290 TaxID=3155811 RepID=UPI0034238FCB